ncbi:hypothetical protein [Streptomyces sp. NPDC093261]|uniref:hypothetical protein n=1 Tax=Streptomyces sp. NPDC093261 TaxID=3366037 RepID=UPI003820F1D0
MTVAELEAGADETAPVPVAVATPPEPAPDQPRRIGGPTRSDVLALTGAAASGICVTILLYGELAPFSGALAFTVTAYLVFLAIDAVLTGC